MRIWLAAITFLFIITMGQFAQAESITKEQGDAILQELREIKQLLVIQQRPQPQAQLGPSKQVTVKIKGGGAHTLDKSDAPVTLIVYTDYQCPFCGRFETMTFPEIKKNFIDTGKVRFIQRDLPLEFHQFALKAAKAARCAEEQGKYWEMSELLFKNQSKLDTYSIAGYAKNLALNTDKFKSCTTSDKYLREIDEEAKYGGTFGITGTPTFILGKVVGDSVEGHMIVGAQPYSAFESMINGLLNANRRK